jgi:deoxyribodipyrimidine photo-lyase
MPHAPDARVSTVVVLFTRDLRVHDQPALTAAIEGAERVVPLFVLDDAILGRFGAPNRLAFLLEGLAALRDALRTRRSDLVVRRGAAVRETLRIARECGAERIHLSEDVSGFAEARLRRLRRAADGERIAVHAFPGVTIVPPGDLSPGDGSGPYRVFTPYWNRWRTTARRSVLAAPGSVPPIGPIDPGPIPEVSALTSGAPVPGLPAGGEPEGRSRLARWLRDGLAAYEERRDDLAAEVTSGLSPYLHFGCISPLEVVERAEAELDGEAFVRQLCWRDFHHQLLAADPSISTRDHRPRGDRWRDDPGALEAWRQGQTGYPIVDAGMRQLLVEGFMHNRARLVTASFLTKHLYVDWRHGADHFARHLVDGDVANNVGNWQWVAGTGADTRPNRVLNPIRQARRFDADGSYVRRFVPELESLDGPDVHEPWRLGPLRPATYPSPIVDHEEAVARFLTARRDAAGSVS